MSMLEIDYRETAVRQARSFAHAPSHTEIEAMTGDYTGGIVVSEQQDRFNRARLVTLSVMQRRSTDGEGDVTISRELAREILLALDNAVGFACFIPRRISDSGVSDYADSVRTGTESAAMRLRRAAMAQGGAA